MKYLLKGNRLPRSYTYESINKALWEMCRGTENDPGWKRLGLGPNTFAVQMNMKKMPEIQVYLHNHRIAVLYLNETIYLNDRGYSTKVTRARMNAALMGIGKHLVAVNRKWKIYEIATGSYEDYFNGMVVSR